MKKLSKQSREQKQEQPESETFICQSCDNSEVFSYEDILRKRKSDPMLIIQGFEHGIPCPLCSDGFMVSQLDLVFHQFASDLFNF